MSGILHKTRFRLRDDARLIDDPRSVWPLPKIGSLAPKLIARADDDTCGVDIGYECPDPRGDLYVPVHAVQSGIIVYAAPGSTGHAITIDHGSWASHYAHLAHRFSTVLAGRQRGRHRVEAGDVIGYAAKSPARVRFEIHEWTEEHGFVPIDVDLRIRSWRVMPSHDDQRAANQNQPDHAAA
ncbi:MAG: peptidoglycan DD-metalloendopeptidase family protein [Kofleriaceae bacterium]